MTLANSRAGRWVTGAQALDAVKDGNRVFISGGAAVPSSIDRMMAEQADRWTRLDLVCDRLIKPLAVFEHPGRPFHLTSLQPSPAVDGMRNAGAFTSAAMPFSRFGQELTAGHRPIDVAIVHVSPPGRDGRVSLGVSVATPLAAIEAAPLVIAQVNPRMPYTFGYGELETDCFDLLVEAEHPLVESSGGGNLDGETASTIGGAVADLVPDGATLQIGIGAVADAVLTALSGHRDLAIHSGMISDGVVELARSGALTGAHHPKFPGKIVTGLVGGSEMIFDFVNNNPDVLMVPVSISHGQQELRALPRFTAVNSAIEVDLGGSANGEAIGRRVVSGPGGAPDYAEAASATTDGQYIVAMAATAARGGVSRIVPKLSNEVPVTVPGSMVTAVVTEHGTAKLRGRSLAERAEALRTITAPEFRDQLD